MKRSLAFSLAIAVTITIMTMGQPLYAQNPQPIQVPNRKASPAPTPLQPCCNITAIDTNTGVVTAKENATGKTFQFKVTDAALLNSLKVGRGIYANFGTRQVSVDGAAPCCAIISISAPPAAGAVAAGQIQKRPTPGQPCCSITAINANTGEVTATENATGRIITFQIAHFQPVDGAKLSQTFKVGGKVDFQPVDGAALKSGSNVRLTALGFQPVDGIVASIGTAATSAAAPMAVGGIRNTPLPGGPCCTITAMDSNTGLVTAKENAKGTIFQFKVTDAALLNSLKIGQGVYANFAAGVVSVDGITPGGTILGTTSTSSAASAATGAAGGMQNGVALAPPAAPPATAGTSSGKPAVKVNSTLSTPTTTAATASPAGNALISLASSDSVPPGAGFQQCCIVTFIGGTVGPGGQSVRGAKVISQGWSFRFNPDSACESKGGWAVGSPLWANFETAQVSFDGGATICGGIYATPVKYQQTVQLDVLPIGVIYVPPGDPHASMTSSINPKQSFSLTNVSSTTTTTVTVARGSGIGDATAVTFTLSTASDSATPTVSNSLTSSLSTMVGSAAQGPGGYPGENDLIWFYVNPGFDVTYIGTWIYADDITHGQRFAPAHQIITVVPHPNVPWKACHATIQELQAYDAGDTVQADARCLNDIPKSSPPAPSGNGFRTITLSPAKKLIQLDPMIVGGGPELVYGGGPQSNPPVVLANPSRFQPLSRSPGEVPGSSYHVTYCSTDSPLTFGETNAQMQTSSTTTTTKFSGGLNFILNPVAIAGQAIKLATGVNLPVPGSAVTIGDAWDVTKTVTNSVTSGTQWNDAGNFGSGTYGTPGNPSCDQSPAMWTTLYYDWANHTVLFWTVPDAGSAVSGTTVPGTDGIFTPVGGGRPMVVRADSTGQFHFKLPPGNYTYRAADGAGHALTTTPLTIAVRQGQPLRLPPVIFDGKATSNLQPSSSGETTQPSDTQIPRMGVSLPAASGTVREEKTKKPAARTQQSPSGTNTNQRNNLGNLNTDTSTINASEGTTEGAIRGVTAAAPPGSGSATTQPGLKRDTTPSTSTTAATSAAPAGAPVAVRPAQLSVIACSPLQVAPGTPFSCKVSLDRTAGAGIQMIGAPNTDAGVQVKIATDPSLASAPAMVTIAPGSDVSEFNIPTASVSQSGPIKVSASYQGVTKIASVSILGNHADTGFDPTIHGFNFTNYFTGQILIDIPGFGTRDLGPTSYGLCGGMSYAALDNFIYGGQIPSDNTPPAPVSGTPLRSYLYGRQHDTFVADNGWMIKRFIEWVARPDTTNYGIKGLDVLSFDEFLANIQPQLAAGHPVPLGLVKANISVGSVTSTDENVLVKNHQVLAIGYQLHMDPVNGTHWDIRIYDPNHPDTIQRMHTHSNVAGYQTADTGTQQTESFRGFFATPYSPKQPYWLSGGQPGRVVAMTEQRVRPQAGAGTQTSSGTLVTDNLQPYTQPPPDPNPNHLPDLVFDNSSSGSLSECSIPAGSSCQVACGSKKIPHNFGVHNLTQYPANGPIQIILTEIASGATRSWTLNHVDGNQWAYSGGFYTMWPCPITTSFPGSGPPDNYTLAVQGPPQLTTNGKTQQLYIPPDAVFCSGNPGFSGCQQ